MDKLKLIRAFAPRIKELVSPEQILRAYVPGMSINQHRFIRCPFHPDKTASMKVHEKRVYCYGCHYLSDVIGIVSSLFMLDMFQAMCKINDDFRLGFPLDRPLTLREGIEVKRRAQDAADKARSDKERRAVELRRFEVRCDLEYSLAFLEDTIQQTRPTDPDASYPIIWQRACEAAERIKYRLKYELYDEG